MGHETVFSWPRLKRWGERISRLLKDVPLAQKLTAIKQEFAPKRDVFDYGIAISHDCDIASDDLEAEPFIEFTRAKVVGKSDSRLTSAKNHRKLQLEADLSGKRIILEMNACDRFRIEKTLLANESPADIKLTKDSRGTLQYWLGTRYRRHSLPNVLDERLKAFRNVVDKFHGKKNEGVLSYWLEIDPDDQELTDGDPYSFTFKIVYDSKNKDGKAQASALQSQIELIRGDKSLYEWIDWGPTQVYSDFEFTYADMRQNMRYIHDHASIKKNSEVFED